MEHVQKENDASNRMFKYAIAMAIIRNKPIDSTAKHYTEELQRKVSKSETTWRAKAKKLEEELEKSRNELALLQLKYSSVTTDYISDEEAIEQSTNQEKEKFSSVNEKFFFSVVNIQRWASILKSNHTVFAIVKQNFIKSLTSFEESVEKVNTAKVPITLPAMNMIADVLKEERIFKDRDVLDTCIHVIESLVRCLLTEGNLKEDKVEKLMQVLDEMSMSCAPIRDIVLEKYALLVSGYTSLLKGLPTILSLDSTKHERIYYICTSMELIATSTLIKWPSQRLEHYEGLLEKDLFSISGSFPLYAHSVWSVLTYMTENRC